MEAEKEQDRNYRLWKAPFGDKWPFLALGLAPAY